MNDFEKKIVEITGNRLHSIEINTIQINVGLKCNQSCVHCHLSSSPLRTEMMEWFTMESIIQVTKQIKLCLIDVTGGAPELNPHFRRFVESIRKQGHSVQVRTNLTVILEPGMETIPEFFKDYKVQLVASLPCYLKDNVCAQRGLGVYEKSIEALKRLNALGYGSAPELQLNLVYNPVGVSLPPEQSELEANYRSELGRQFGITFNKLLTITNMPVGRFYNVLRKQKKEQKYLQLLKKSFNHHTLDKLMCRHQINVGWDGRIYDCDFNLALGLPVDHGIPNHMSDFNLSALTNRKIFTGDHCFGCTAGAGSSCGGALT